VRIPKNKSFKSYFPFVVFIGLNGETGFFYSRKQISFVIALPHPPFVIAKAFPTFIIANPFPPFVIANPKGEAIQAHGMILDCRVASLLAMTRCLSAIAPPFPLFVMTEVYTACRITVAGMDSHRRSNHFISLREEYALCNPPFLET
jgi:hypothetical protein